MPTIYHERGNISMVDLFAEAGGPDAIENITEADLAEALLDLPGAVDSWLQLSEDNRSSPAWFVRQKKDSPAWEVGYYPDGKSTYFDNLVDACANYIRHYLDQLIGIIR